MKDVSAKLIASNKYTLETGHGFPDLKTITKKQPWLIHQFPMNTTLSLFELEDYWEKMKWTVVSIEIILYIVFYLVYVLQMPFRSILGISLSFNLSLLPLALFLISCASWLQLLVPREWELLKIRVLFQKGKQHFSIKKNFFCMHALSCLD